jgi:hypothetical protein
VKQIGVALVGWLFTILVIGCEKEVSLPPVVTPPPPPAVTKVVFTIPYQSDFKEICGKRWLDRATTAKAESNFNAKAKSFDGGEGLGQATGSSWPWYISQHWVTKGSSPFEPREAIKGINGHEGYLEVRWRAKGIIDQFLNWCATGMAYNGGEKQTWTAIQAAEQAGLEGPEGWLLSLHGKGAKYTPNYIHNKIAIRTKYRKNFGE